MAEPTHHLAQTNVGVIVAPIDSEELAGFVELLEPLNALADGSPGFVWRLQTEAGNATGVRIEPDPLVIVNLSVWSSREALWDYVYRSPHLDAMRRRREWFLRHLQPYLALWWVPAGTLPTVDDARERVEHLRAHGPTPHAFSFRQAYDAEGAALPSPGPAGG